MKQTTWPSFSMKHLSGFGKVFGFSFGKRNKEFFTVPKGSVASLQPNQLGLVVHLHHDGSLDILNSY